MKLVKLDAGHYTTEDRRFRIVRHYGRMWENNFYWQVTDRHGKFPFPNPYGKTGSNLTNERTLSDARETIKSVYTKETK